MGEDWHSQAGISLCTRLTRQGPVRQRRSAAAPIAKPVARCEPTPHRAHTPASQGLPGASHQALAGCRRTQAHAAARQQAAQLPEAVRQRRAAHGARHTVYGGPAFGVAPID